jgi:hypothetical protein
MITTGKELAEKFAAIGDNTIVVEYWSYEDVLDFVENDSYYGEGTEDVAREVWGKVAVKLLKFDNVDNDIVRDTISIVLDERAGGN